MQQKAMVSKKDFQKNPDGSWTCIKNTDIKSVFGIFRINPSMTFKKTFPVWGIDVAELLDQQESEQ